MEAAQIPHIIIKSNAVLKSIYLGMQENDWSGNA